MFTLKGKYETAKVFTDLCEEVATSQIIELLNQPFAKDSHPRFMPDVHAGKGCVVGTTMHITDKICPNLVGVDIGCGLEIAPLLESHLDLKRLDDLLNNGKIVPSGFNKRETIHSNINKIKLKELKCYKDIDIELAEYSLGSLGGGNHFIEINISKSGQYYLVIHSGSRHLGLEVCNYYQKLAEKSLTNDDKEKLIEKYKKEKRTHEIQDALKKLFPKVPKHLAYLTNNNLNDYLHDMHIVQEYAKWNRKTIVHEIVKNMDWKVDTNNTFTTIHNYINKDDMILRKGAISAKKDEKLIIPLSMRDGSILAKGLGNAEWNQSAPHGAGRIMSRSKAKENIDLDKFKEQMKDIYTTSVVKETLDEAPDAYKPPQSIIENTKETIEIIEIIKPVYNFKAH